MIWYNNLTEWREERDYDSPDGVTGNLREFYEALKNTFPPMNGPDAFDFDMPRNAQLKKKTGLWARFFGRKSDQINSDIKINEAMVTDYCIASNAIYLSFAWSIAEEAHEQVISTALATKVGFFDVSADEGEILHYPDQFKRITIS